MKDCARQPCYCKRRTRNLTLPPLSSQVSCCHNLTTCYGRCSFLHLITVLVTEDEIHHGLNDVIDAATACLWYKRIFTDLALHTKDPALRKYRDLNNGSIDRPADALLATLLAELQARIPNTVEHRIEFQPRHGIDPTQPSHAAYLQALASDFESRASAALDTMYASLANGQRDPLLREVRQHLDFANERCLLFQGREAELVDIAQYLGRASPGYPYVLVGESGTGKTSLVAKAIFDRSAQLGNAAIVTRFIGITQSSATVRNVLHSVCCQLHRLGFWPEDAGAPTELEGEALDELVPVKYSELVAAFHAALGCATASQPLVLVLDSLDQLSEDYDGRSLAWLPVQLPDDVHVLVSTLPGMEYGCLPALEAKMAACNLNVVECCRVLRPLAPIACNDTLTAWLELEGRCLATNQREGVTKAFESCSTPLFLRLIRQQVSQWHSYTPVMLPLSVPGAIAQLFTQLEQEHGTTLVTQALGYLTASRYCLSSSEMTDLLSCNDAVLNEVFQWWLPPVRQIPPLIWTMIQAKLSPYLVGLRCCTLSIARSA